MVKYVIRRLAIGLAVLVGLLTVTFVVLHAVPGDPVRQALGARASDEAVAALRSELGLDGPILKQYLTYAERILRGDMGVSLALNSPVSTILGQRLTPSVLLITYGLLIALILGVPLAIAAARRPGGAVDHAIRVATTFLFGMPAFWLGLMLALLFGLKLGWLPVSGYRPGFIQSLYSLALPSFTLGFSILVIVTRTLRANLVAVLQSEYIEAARSRGISEARIIFKHALRNALMPTLTILSALIGYLIGGTVVIEQVFQIPGIGSLLVRSILQNDYVTVQAIALISGVAVVATALLTDLLQVALDPRIRI